MWEIGSRPLSWERSQWVVGCLLTGRGVLCLFIHLDVPQQLIVAELRKLAPGRVASSATREIVKG